MRQVGSTKTPSPQRPWDRPSLRKNAWVTLPAPPAQPWPTPDEAPALRDLLSDPDPEVRCLAIGALLAVWGASLLGVRLWTRHQVIRDLLRQEGDPDGVMITLPDASAEDRAALIDAMNAVQETLEADNARGRCRTEKAGMKTSEARGIRLIVSNS